MRLTSVESLQHLGRSRPLGRGCLFRACSSRGWSVWSVPNESGHMFTALRRAHMRPQPGNRQASAGKSTEGLGERKLIITQLSPTELLDLKLGEASAFSNRLGTEKIGLVHSQCTSVSSCSSLMSGPLPLGAG